MNASKKSPSTFECFGLVVQGYATPEALSLLLRGIADGKQCMAVTANPEILLYAKRHADYWNTLRQADLRLVDSFGLQLAGRLKGAKTSRLPGVDFAQRLIAEAATRSWKVALIGSSEGVADKAAWELRRKYPNLQVMAEQGGKVAEDGSDDESGAEARFRLTQFAPDVVLVAFGHPRQEAWIVRNLHDMPSVKIAVGVGGTLDYWSGKAKRAPSWMQKLGLEWMYRLLVEPKRWRRILDAVMVFPFYFILDMLSGNRLQKI